MLIMAIPAKIKELPNSFNPIIVPKYVSIPPTDAPRTRAGENTPPKKPRLRHIIVTKSFRHKIENIKYGVYELSRNPTIVSPPSPRTSGTNPPTNPY